MVEPVRQVERLSADVLLMVGQPYLGGTPPHLQRLGVLKPPQPPLRLPLLPHDLGQLLSGPVQALSGRGLHAAHRRTGLEEVHSQTGHRQDEP